MQTIKEVEQYAAENGLMLSKADRALIGATQSAERERLAGLVVNTAPDMAERFNRFYPRLLQFIIALGETVLTFAQTIIVSLGVPIVLVLLLVVEHQRVVHGILLFEIDIYLASFAAMALVVANLVLEFQIHHIEQAAGYIDAKARKWSLRIWAINALYTLGIGEQWQEQYLSPADRYKKLLRLVTFTILALALVGSMKSVMEEATGTWHQALIAIVTDSSLIKMMTWVGGLLFAVAAVLTAQGLSRYVAIRCVEIIGAMKLQQLTIEADPLQAAIEEAGANAALAIVKDKIEKKQNKAARAMQLPPQPQEEVTPLVQTGLPFGHTALALGLASPESTVMNGHGNGHGGTPTSNGNGNH